MLRKSCIPLFCLSLVAQAPEGGGIDTTDLELLELLNTPITVASKKASTIREQPGIVSLVTRQDIQASGARDLVDILNMVPGFAFAKDTQGTVGVGIRGLYGFEGKVLLLIDGMEINEPLYGNVSFDNHVSADIVQRVEIIRGPGSAIYGGTAELAVINVVTRSAGDTNNGFFAQGLGYINGTDGRRSSAVSVAKAFPDGKFSLSLSALRSPQSNQDYKDVAGDTYNMSRQSDVSSTFASLGLEYYGVQFRGLLDNYSVDQRDHWNPTIMPNVITQRWNSYYLDLRRTFNLSETFTMTPFMQFRRQYPWASDPVRKDLADPSNIYYSNRKVDRTSGGLQLMWDPTQAVNVLLGAEAFHQTGREFYRDGTEPTSIANNTGSAYYAQGLLKTNIVNITLGARYETHSAFESSFVPRLGLTKVWDKFHMKLLITKAFRTPFVQNININPDLKPEKTTAIELEAGYQLTKQSYLVMNVFDTTIKRPIVYYVDVNNNYADAYQNFDKMGSRGAEVEYRLQHPLGTMQASYSYYQNNDTQVPLYTIPTDDKSLIAFPRHKLVLNSTFKLGDSWNLFASAVYFGERWAWLYTPSTADGRLDKLDAAVLFNLVLTYKGLYHGLDISLGAYNVGNKDYVYPQGYGNWNNATGAVTTLQTPRPGQSQEFLMKVAYSF